MPTTSTSPALIYGSMRIRISSDRDQAYWLGLLRRVHAAGIHSMHLSSEYDSYQDTLALLRILKDEGIRFEYVVKLAEPDFGAGQFLPEILLEKVSAYQRALSEPHLHTLQWMWRGDLKNDAERIAGAMRDAAQLRDAFAVLRHSGMVGDILCFPYTDAFGRLALAQPWCDGLTVYLNPVEQEALPLCRQAAAAGKRIVAIRPYAASNALAAGHTASDCLGWVAQQPAVQGVVLTFSSPQHFPAHLQVAA